MSIVFQSIFGDAARLLQSYVPKGGSSANFLQIHLALRPCWPATE